MNPKVLTALGALALTTSLAGSGCMARSGDTEDITAEPEQVVNGADIQATEKTGEADEAWFGGWGGFGWGGFGWGRFGWGGFGWGGFGWGGFGWGGFGWGRFGWGGFGWGGWW